MKNYLWTAAVVTGVLRVNISPLKHVVIPSLEPSLWAGSNEGSQENFFIEKLYKLSDTLKNQLYIVRKNICFPLGDKVFHLINKVHPWNTNMF